MNLRTLPLGIIGITLAVAGMIGYSLAPDKLWLVTVAESLALACLIAFFIVHFKTFKAFSARRSTRMGANSLLMVLFFVGILTIVNFLAARHSVRWDLSENMNFSLAPQTHRVIRSLPRDVKITVFTREKDPGYQSYKERLDSYRQASSKITVEFVDPERQPKLAQSSAPALANALNSLPPTVMTGGVAGAPRISASSSSPTLRRSAQRRISTSSAGCTSRRFSIGPSD